MTVFKGYMKITKRNMGMILMYLVIFLGLSMAMQNLAKQNEVSDYAAEKLNIAVVDKDGGTLAKGLISYLNKYHNVSSMENDKGVMQEALYYEDVELIVRIPVDFMKKCLQNGEKLPISKVPGSYNSIYAQQQITTFLNQVRTYTAAGYSVEESLDKIESETASKVTMIDLSGNQGQMPAHGYMFRYFPYLYISVLCYVLGLILVSFRQIDIRRRMLASAVSLKRQTIEAAYAFLLLGTGLWVITILLAAALNGTVFLTDKNVIYYAANSFVMMLVTLAIAFLLGMLVSKPTLVTTIVTPLSLGMCFTCGVFVPLAMLGKGVKRVAQFFPFYWYERVNDTLSEYQNIAGSVKMGVLRSIGLQILFAAAVVGVALVISRYKQQEQ